MAGENLESKRNLKDIPKEKALLKMIVNLDCQLDWTEKLLGD
jgi:hypothetical protein